jgi:hypothetical protein
MTTTAAESLLGLEHRLHGVLDHGRPEGEAQLQDSDEAKLDRRSSTHRLLGAFVPVLAAVQVVWIGGLAYGVWALLL